MNTTLGYKVEKINVSSLFRGFQNIYKTRKDKFDQKIVWVYASKISGGVQTNAVLKYNTETKATERIIDFGENEIYSMHFSESYIAFLSSPKTPGTKRYLSFLNRSGGATEPLKSLIYSSTVNPAQEFSPVYEDNMMHFDGRFYWVIPKNPNVPIKKVDIVDIGSGTGLEGISAPGGSCYTALTADVTGWCPVANPVLDNKAYFFQGSLYFLPRNTSLFKLDVATGVSTVITNIEYNVYRTRISHALYQLEEEAEFSESGEIILLALHEDATTTSPINTLGIMDLTAMEFTTFPLADYPNLKGPLSRVNLVEDDKIFFMIPSGEKKGIYFDCNDSATYEYHLLSADASVYATAKTPGSFLGSDIVLFMENNSLNAYRMTKTTPCRVIVHHNLDTGEAYGPEEIFYGEEEQEYSLMAKAIEGKEVSSVVGNRTGAFTKEDIVVDFYYSPIKTKTFIKISSQDAQGNTLQEYTLEGFVGDSYQSTAAEIPGYSLTASPGNASGVLEEENLPVVYTYRKLTADEVYSGSSYLSISYEDDLGNQVIPSLYAVFPLGSSYNIPAEEITGFTLTSSPTVSGTCYDNTEYVVFRYVRKTGVGLARINYMAGTTVMKTVYVEGAIGASSTYAVEEIQGFEADVTSLSINLKEIPDTYEVICDPVVGLLLIHHKDVYDEKDIFPKEYFFAGLEGETEFAVRSKIISNYKTTEEFADKARFSGEHLSWSIYKKDSLYTSLDEKIYEIEIRYDTVSSSVLVVYRKDDTVLQEKRLYGLNREDYFTEALDYDEYQIQSISGEPSGKFGSREKTVSYLYEDRVCHASIEHLDQMTGELISRTDHTQVYGTQLAVPFESFTGYTYTGTSLNTDPEQGLITFSRDPVYVKFYHMRISPQTMMKPLLKISREPAGVEIDCRVSSKIIEGIRYKVEKRLNGGAWTPCLPVEVDSDSLRTSLRVLNLIEEDGTQISYTPYGGSLKEIPSKAILKSWLETENNGIQVDYLDAREFELSPDLYLKDENGKIKYTAIVNGTYSVQEKCLFNERGEKAIQDWVEMGMGYVDCSRRYRKSGRNPAVSTDKDLMIGIIKDMAGTTGRNRFVSEAKKAPPLNQAVKIDDIKYDKISNRIVIRVSEEDNGAANPEAIYEYRVEVINCNDGSKHSSTDPSPTSTINTTMPLEKYLFCVDDNAYTYPPEIKYSSSTLYHSRGETIKFIDKYIHVVGEDLLGRRTELLNQRYYKEITIEDLNSINSVITYSPKIIKENHRYRGPMESRKFNNFQTEVVLTFKELYNIFDRQNIKLKEIRSHSNTETYNLYIDLKDRSDL